MPEFAPESEGHVDIRQESDETVARESIPLTNCRDIFFGLWTSEQVTARRAPTLGACVPQGISVARNAGGFMESTICHEPKQKVVHVAISSFTRPEQLEP